MPNPVTHNTAYAIAYTRPQLRCAAPPLRGKITRRNAAIATREAAVCGKPRKERSRSRKCTIVLPPMVSVCREARNSNSGGCHEENMTFVTWFCERPVSGDSNCELWRCG